MEEHRMLLYFFSSGGVCECLLCLHTIQPVHVLTIRHELEGLQNVRRYLSLHRHLGADLPHGRTCMEGGREMRERKTGRDREIEKW